MTQPTESSEQMQGSEAELLAMTGAMEELHQESMPTVRRELAEMGEQLRAGQKAPVSRRIFVMGGLTAAGGLALAACGSSSKKSTAAAAAASSPSAAGSASSSGTALTGDLKVVGLAAALENLAVAAYGIALKRATAGKLGRVPPAIGTFAQTAMAQHKDHAAAWNAVLQAAGKKPITGTPLTIATSAAGKLQAATSVASVATQALALEQAATETYLAAASTVTAPQGISTAASIAPVEAMHAAILSFVLGKYPVPASFIGTSNAVPATAFTG